ncbi:MAG: dihydroorotate dehydrogenase B catalytic subunit [Acidimicrobium sp.]|nr:MAG: dihydroorotate dehydrogenase B catalytic subunit [Acidimicrobium sp.]
MNRKAISIGSVELAQPILTASGTAGYGAEFDSYFPLREIGAVVTKSVAHFAWPGNAAPRLHPTKAGMLNAVGLQGSGVASFIERDLPLLQRAGAKVVVSIWGHSIDDYLQAAKMLATVRNEIAAIEVNLSCPNLSGDHAMFSHDATLSAQVIESCLVAELPLWAKLSPNTSLLVDVARAVHSAGAQAVTLVNTAIGMAIDTDTGLPVLGNIRGGLSGSALHPIAVRCIYEVRAALPRIKILGAGGVVSGETAAELMLAGADAVQIGTATFADPKAPIKILRQLNKWADVHSISDWSQVTSASHRGGLHADA